MTANLVLASLAVLLALLLSGRFKPASLFVIWAVGYHLLIGTDEKSFLASYVNPGVVTLALLLMVSLVLERAPLLDALPARLLRGRPTLAVLRLTGFTAVASAFINNTASVATSRPACRRCLQRACPCRSSACWCSTRWCGSSSSPRRAHTT